LLLEPVDRDLPEPQTAQLRSRSNSMFEAFVSALNDLEWLKKIVASYGEQHGFDIVTFCGLAAPVRLLVTAGAPARHPCLLFAAPTWLLVSHMCVRLRGNIAAGANVARPLLYGQLNVLRFCKSSPAH